MKKNSRLNKRLPGLFSLILLALVLFKGTAMADGFMPPATDPLYKKECGACHWAFLPGLLPERSWNKMLDSLKTHFGEDVSLKTGDVGHLKKYLGENAADRVRAKRSGKILRSIPGGETPMRITEIPYIMEKHREINSQVYQRKDIRTFSNCAACHPGASQGSFEEEEVKISGAESFHGSGGSFAPPSISISQAIDIATSRYPGQAVEVELEKDLYEIKLIAENGTRRKIYVDAQDGGIVEKKNVSLEKALAVVRKAMPGRIIKVEFEGGAYEIKVRTPEGRIREVFVNARDGKIVKNEEDD